MGANPQAAALSGLPYLRVIFVGHVVSAVISVLCGFILVGFVGKAGLAVAAFMLTYLFNCLTSLGLGEPGRLMLQGAIIAVAALAYSLNKR